MVTCMAIPAIGLCLATAKKYPLKLLTHFSSVIQLGID